MHYMYMHNEAGTNAVNIYTVLFTACIHALNFNVQLQGKSPVTNLGFLVGLT